MTLLYGPEADANHPLLGAGGDYLLLAARRRFRYWPRLP